MKATTALAVLLVAAALTSACRSPYLPLARGTGSPGGGGSGGGTPVVTGGSGDPGAPSFTFVAQSGMQARYVAGQADMVTNTQWDTGFGGVTAQGDSFPVDVQILADGRVFVADGLNSRIKGYAAVPSSNNPTPDYLWGTGTTVSGYTPADLWTSPGVALPAVDGAAASQYATFNGGSPGFQGLAHTGTRLGIGDANRYLVFDNAFVHAGEVAQAQIGDGTHYDPSNNTVHSRSAVHFDWLYSKAAFGGGKAVITDLDVVAPSRPSRVLLYNALPSSGTLAGVTADLALGATGLTEAGFPASGAYQAVSASNFSEPRGVWTNGQQILVADRGRSRVLIWNHWPTANGQAADLVLGQPDFTSDSGNCTDSTLQYPQGVWSNGTRIYVADTENNRVLVWDSWPTQNGQAADHVIGQPDFTHNNPQLDDWGLNNPVAVAGYGDQLVVVDQSRNAILVYSSGWGTPKTNVANTPTIGRSPSGTYVAGDTVTITLTGTAGDSFYYTTDNSMPTTSSTLYTGSFTVTRASAGWKTIKAIAVNSSAFPSNIRSAQLQWVLPSFPGSNGSGAAVWKGVASGTATNPYGSAAAGSQAFGFDETQGEVLVGKKGTDAWGWSDNPGSGAFDDSFGSGAVASAVVWDDNNYQPAAFGSVVNGGHYRAVTWPVQNTGNFGSNYVDLWSNSTTAMIANAGANAWYPGLEAVGAVASGGHWVAHLWHYYYGGWDSDLDLDSSADPSVATSVTVDPATGDLIIGGVVFTSGHDVPVYWTVPSGGSVSGPVTLPFTGAYDRGQVFAVAWDGTHIYAAGAISDGTTDKAAVWKDGVLVDSSQNGAATQLFAIGTRVFAGGTGGGNAVAREVGTGSWNTWGGGSIASWVWSWGTTSGDLTWPTP